MSSRRLLFAIVSCERDKHTHDVIRRTWASRMPLGCDYRFFMGRGATERDEVALDCDDSYQGLTEKALATFEWSLGRGYTNMLHVGRDTYVSPVRVTSTDLWDKDYAGNCGCRTEAGYCPLRPFNDKVPFHYASGGSGSWLSDGAMRVILKSKVRHWADDLMFGWALGEAGIPLWSDARFQKRGKCFYDTRMMTVHLQPKGTDSYLPEYMLRAEAYEIKRKAICS